MRSEPTNRLLATHDPISALRWDALLELQVSAYLPYELSFYFGWSAWDGTKRVLDAGCGNGYFLSQLRRYFPHKSYTGLDLSEELVATARANAGLSGVEIVKSDFFAYEASAKFDTVIMRLIVQHMAGFEQIFGKLEQLIETGGCVVIVEPEPRSFLNYPRTPVFENLLSAYAAHAAQNRLNRASLNTIRDEFSKREGWTIEEDRTYVAPTIGPFESTTILQIYTLWISLFRNAPGLDFPFEAARLELEQWAKNEESFSQVGIRILAARRHS